MAVRFIGSTVTKPQTNADFIGAASGGTLAGGQVVQLVWDDVASKFDSTQLGKDLLCAYLVWLTDRIQGAKSWPIDSTS